MGVVLFPYSQCSYSWIMFLSTCAFVPATDVMVVFSVCMLFFVIGGIWVFGGRKMRSSSMDIVESGYVKYDAEVPNFRTNEYLERELRDSRQDYYRLKNDYEELLEDYDRVVTYFMDKILEEEL